jgi:hypothetical protein
VDVIEDHTHDPWSDWARESRADWCIASFRKTLPLPDGAVLWSPRDHPVPPPAALTTDQFHLAGTRLGAMALKARYLRGEPIAKELFRGLLVSCESRVGTGRRSGMSPFSRSLLDTFPVASWRAKRKANADTFAARMAEGAPELRLLPADPGAVPLGVVLVCDSPARRAHLRAELIRSKIYPAILWPLDHPRIPDVPADHLDLSSRMLFLHSDMRYDADDMIRVARAVREINGTFESNARKSVRVD